MVGECRIKKIYRMLGVLQRPFREHAFLPKGGDALTTLILCLVSYGIRCQCSNVSNDTSYVKNNHKCCHRELKLG